jgi:hypothetical protein
MHFTALYPTIHFLHVVVVVLPRYLCCSLSVLILLWLTLYYSVHETTDSIVAL